MQVFTSWSGGKDCCLALYRALKSGMDVRYLANMVTEDGKYSWTHGQTARLLRTQSRAIGVPLLQQVTSEDDYRKRFLFLLLDMKRRGIASGVFGDIDMEEHRDWVENICKEAEILPFLPLWKEDQETLFREFISLGFEAIIISTREDLLGEEWLGRKVDFDTLEQLKAMPGITTCGEAGEYHTFVVDGPIFHQRIEVRNACKLQQDGNWVLRITDTELQTKE